MVKKKLDPKSAAGQAAKKKTAPGRTARPASPAKKAPQGKKLREKIAAARGPAQKKASGGKKAAPQKAAPKKAAPKKAAPKKAAPKQAAPKQAVPKKAAPKQAAPKKAAPKKAAPKKAQPRKETKSSSARHAPVSAAPKKVTAKGKAAPSTPQTRAQAQAQIAAQRRKARPTGRVDEERKRHQFRTAQGTQMAGVPGNRPPKYIVEIDRPTGMYNGILLAENPKPFPKKTPYSMKEIARLREALLLERQKLVRELNSMHGASRDALDVSTDHPGYSVHLAEHATDLQTAEATLGVRSIEQERFELVEEAIHRIESNINHYGLCLACGNKIGIQRLIARPHAHLCMDCRQRYEKIRARRGL